jgi:hypothetical protein
VLSALEDHGYHTKDSPAQGSTLVTASHSLDRLMVSADDGNAVSDAGLLVAASLGQHLGLPGLLAEHVTARGDLTEEQLDEALDVLRVTHP